MIEQSTAEQIYIFDRAINSFFFSQAPCMVHFSPDSKSVAPKKAGLHQERFLIRNDFLSLIYYGLLREFSFSDAAKFWKNHSLYINDRYLAKRELYEYIGNPRHKAPFEYVFAVLNSLEPFFVERGQDLRAFLKRNILELRQGASLAPLFALWSFVPLLRPFLESKDPRDFLLDGIQVINSRARPGTLQKLIRRSQNAGITRSLILFTPDPSFSREFSSVDGDLFFAQTLQLAPVRIGFEPFDTYRMISESRNAISRISEHTAALRGDTLYIDGVAYGRQCMFDDFLSERSIKTGLKAPNRKVIVMNQDYVCPSRGRIVLHEGCAYGAPIYLYEMEYRPLSTTPSFSAMIKDALKGDTLNDTEDCDRHMAFLKACRDHLRFIFDCPSEYVILEGRRLTRGIQARILAHILHDFSKGSSHFSYAQLARNQSLISHPANTGLAIRIARIQKILEKECPALKILSRGRGEFQVSCDCPVSLEYCKKSG